MGYAYDASLIERVMPRIKQWEATTGRRIQPSMLDSLIKGQLGAEADKAQQSRALDIQENQFAFTKEQADKASKAATIKGAFDMATTTGMLGLTYHALSKPSAMSELLAYQKAQGGVKGVQTAFAGNTAAIGAQVIPGASPAFTGATGTAAYGAAEGSGAAGVLGAEGAGGIGLGTMGLVGGALVANYMAGKALQPTMDKLGFPTAGKFGTYAGLPGVVAGASVDVAKKGFDVVKDIGSVIGNIFGW